MKVDNINNDDASKNNNDLIFLDDSAIQRCGKSHIVNGRFIIDKSKPLDLFSNSFCKAYSASDMQNSTHAGCYAKLLEKTFLYNVDAIISHATGQKFISLLKMVFMRCYIAILIQKFYNLLC